MIRCTPLFLLLCLPALIVGCQPASEPEAPSPQEHEQTGDQAAQEEVSPPTADDFDALAENLIEEMLALNPEWAIRQGRYENAGSVTIPDEEHRRRMA